MLLQLCLSYQLQQSIECAYKKKADTWRDYEVSEMILLRGLIVVRVFRLALLKIL
jgi:hypothetical protein